MLARLDMKLSAKAEEVSYQMSSAFHGVLMELLPESYAEELHISKKHPYTQHIERRSGEWHWIITALNEYTVHRMLNEALMPLNEFTIKRHQLNLKIVEKLYQEVADKELAHAFYQNQANKYITIQFVTPTAFKSYGRYINYPDIRMIFSNIMKSYDAANLNERVYDEDTLEQLVDKAVLSRYELRSSAFSLEGVRIPAFIGTMTIKMTGTQVMTNFANMLFCFSSYSGIGIKTALGMGAIKILEERTGENARQAD